MGLVLSMRALNARLGGSPVHALVAADLFFWAIELVDRCLKVLPPGWVDLARSGTRAERGGRYGAGWWIEPAPGADVGPYFRALTSKSAGPDLFNAQGFQGQLVVVVPSRDLVVVRLGLIDDRIGWPPLREWMHRLVALFPVAASPASAAGAGSAAAPP